MGISYADLVTESIRKILIDRSMIQNLTEVQVKYQIQLSNQSNKTIYIKALLSDAGANWTFDDGTTAKNLGSIGAFGTTTFTVTIKRPVPASDVEDEQIDFTFEVYSDSGYTNKLNDFTKQLIVDIVDVNTNASWSKPLSWDFDDGTAQGWTLNLFTISDKASIQAGGYAPYYYHYGAYTTVTPYIEQSITIPIGSKVYLLFFFGGYAWSTKSGWYARLNYVRVYVNGEKILENRVWEEANNSNKVIGWYQQSVDLSAHAGQTVTLKIELEVQNNATYDVGIHSAVDNVMIATKT